eukprot:SAG31_NODE_1680_length_7539_cov_29.860484_3_plen_236_part_00
MDSKSTAVNQPLMATTLADGLPAPSSGSGARPQAFPEAPSELAAPSVQATATTTGYRWDDPFWNDTDGELSICVFRVFSVTLPLDPRAFACRPGKLSTGKPGAQRFSSLALNLDLDLKMYHLYQVNHVGCYITIAGIIAVFDFDCAPSAARPGTLVHQFALTPARPRLPPADDLVETFQWDLTTTSWLCLTATCLWPATLLPASLFCYPCYAKQNIGWEARAQHVAVHRDGEDCL